MPGVRVRRPLLVALAALAFGPAAAATTPALAEGPLPVTYTPAPLLQGGFTPDTVAGANDFACKPSAEHPNPVVLVHGLGATLGDNWATMSPLLKNNGFCVFGLTYGRQDGLPYVGGIKRMEDSSAALATLVDKVLAATGAKKVDLLGHSEGTVMPRWYLSFRGGAAKVDKYVQLTPLWDGTNLAGIGTLLGAGRALGLESSIYDTFAGVGCGSCPEFARGSDYLNKVNAAGPAVPGITYTEIVTKYDELVQPYTSGFLDAPNVTNILLQDVCPKDLSEHLAVAYSPTAAQLVLNALAPAEARPARCTSTTPLGTPAPPDVGLDRTSTTTTAPTASGTKTPGRQSASQRQAAAKRKALVKRRALARAKAKARAKRKAAARPARRRR